MDFRFEDSMDIDESLYIPEQEEIPPKPPDGEYSLDLSENSNISKKPFEKDEKPKEISLNERIPDNKNPACDKDNTEEFTLNIVEPFVKMIISKDHAFRKMNNTVYAITEDLYPETEIIKVLVEKGLINIKELRELNPTVGNVVITEAKGLKFFGLILKAHIDVNLLKINVKKCVKILASLIDKFQIKELHIIRDKEIMKPTEVTYFIELCEKAFLKKRIKITFFHNTIKIPPVEEREKLIRLYHESPAGCGHRGQNQSLSRIMNDFYWKGIQEEVNHIVKCCTNCQKLKLQRKKTRLPLLITDTPIRGLSKISLDFYGPLKTTKNGNTYILTMQCMLTKFFVAAPLKNATAEETARALVDKLMCLYGIPSAILTDQGTNFISRILEELARIFRIEKYRTSAFHPQSQGGIERMHHTLTEYIKQFTTDYDEWDEILPLATFCYNACKHEAHNYQPYELIFGRKAQLPSFMPPKEELIISNKYLESLVEDINHLQRLAGLNLIQSKYRSKYYYDRKLNPKQFREGERVYLINESKEGGKFKREYVGPYEINKIDREKHIVELQHGNHPKIVHIDKLKRAFEAEKEGCSIISPKE